MTPGNAFLGWPAVHLDNGLVRAVMVPDVGGRVLQFWLEEHPYLFVNPHLAGRLFTPEENWGDGTIASWKNYGGNKTWPAPQGWSGADEWAGPPDPVLDSGRFRTLRADPMSAVVESPPDPRTGLQISRELTLEPGAARAVLRRTMRNIGDRPVRWSLWDVTQLDCGSGRGAVRPGCRMSIPLNPSSEFPGGYSVQYGPPDNPQWRMEHPSVFGIEYAGVLGKVGFDSAAGWVAFSDAGWVFVHQFEVEPGSSYPDGGATVEVWTHGPGIAAGVDFGQEQLRGEFMEMEVLGPMVSLSPGEETSADLLWAACRCPGMIVDASPVSCTGQPLEVERHGDMAHLRGTFGIFAPGRVQLRVHSGLESEKASQVLLERPAGPREPVILDDHIALPEGTLELVVLDARGADSGTIAHAEVTR